MTTETEDELSNVLAFPAREESEKNSLPFLPEGTGKRLCPHDIVWVNEQDRQVRCRRCEFVLDPFVYMLSVAKKETQLADTVKYLRQEEKQRRQNIEKLIQIERNAKARIRKAGHKEPLPLWQNERIEQ
ncbi:hypothetical protein EH228_04515 [Erwinia endophytica]|uniref:hypothetical protein n=1 Tax=Erwinia endophytica TaxID=1563158 RepID=UPI001265DF9C|nr:hypothetical protein [Erwinia endophytica]KAB8312945.1 hypothetical protein EH228_04515 [Erwinia endophytica]